jgi:tyrosyl-tRNA synthetase
MKLSEELIWRGFKAENTFADPAELDTETRTFYLGADPTADSLQIGNLAAIMMAKCFIRHGYKAVLLVGGATGLIGDPKMSSERELKPLDEIAKNKAAIHAQFERIVGEAELVDNYDWFKDIKFTDFMREVGKEFSMTQLLDREFVKARVGDGKTGLSFAEFSYSTMQGYDYLWLFRNKGVTLQLCGADQYGNCVSGMHLIRRLENARADVWSTPLILDSGGKKFGKSEGNAVWLSAAKTSPFKFYQFWLNVDDAGVENYLKVYTELEPDDVAKIMSEQSANPGARAAQKALAAGVTKIVHGDAAAEAVRKASDVLFSSSHHSGLDPESISILKNELPNVRKNTTLVKALVDTGLASSNSEATRLIKANAVSVNGQKVATDVEITETSLIKKGKNGFALVL